MRLFDFARMDNSSGKPRTTHGIIQQQHYHLVSHDPTLPLLISLNLSPSISLLTHTACYQINLLSTAHSERPEPTRVHSHHGTTTVGNGPWSSRTSIDVSSSQWRSQHHAWRTVVVSKPDALDLKTGRTRRFARVEGPIGKDGQGARAAGGKGGYHG